MPNRLEVSFGKRIQLSEGTVADALLGGAFATDTKRVTRPVVVDEHDRRSVAQTQNIARDLGARAHDSATIGEVAGANLNSTALRLRQLVDDKAGDLRNDGLAQELARKAADL